MRDVPGSEAGQTTVLVLGLALICFAIAGLAVDGTRAWLYRRTLQNAADASVLAGAAELNRDIYYESAGDIVELDVRAAQGAAAVWLAKRGLPLNTAIHADPTGIRVEVRGAIDTTFLGIVGVRELPVAAVARAEPVAGAP
jgi:Flp pilus assembly protein TadG